MTALVLVDVNVLAARVLGAMVRPVAVLFLDRDVDAAVRMAAFSVFLFEARSAAGGQVIFPPGRKVLLTFYLGSVSGRRLSVAPVRRREDTEGHRDSSV